MGDATVDLNIRDELARIDRQRAETQKFQAETEKFVTEQRKLMANATKLPFETRKDDRDAALSKWQVRALLAGTAASAVASLLSLARSWGLF